MEKVKIGEIVFYYPGKDDQEAQTNNAFVVPAIVVTDFGDGVLNLRVFQDGEGAPLWRTSVSNKENINDVREGSWSDTYFSEA